MTGILVLAGTPIGDISDAPSLRAQLENGESAVSDSPCYRFDYFSGETPRYTCYVNARTREVVYLSDQSGGA